MYFVWMSVTSFLRVLGDGPEEESERVVYCELSPLRGRRESGGGGCTEGRVSITREWRHVSARAIRVAPQEVMPSHWNDGVESAWHKAGTDLKQETIAEEKKDTGKQTNPPQGARTGQKRNKRKKGDCSRERRAGGEAVWRCGKNRETSVLGLIERTTEKAYTK